MVSRYGWFGTQTAAFPSPCVLPLLEVADITLAKEVIEQAITNLGEHARIVSIAIDRGFMDGKLLWWLNREGIIFYIPAKIKPTRLQ